LLGASADASGRYTQAAAALLLYLCFTTALLVLDSCFTESAAASGRYTKLGKSAPEESQASCTREQQQQQQQQQQVEYAVERRLAMWRASQATPLTPTPPTPEATRRAAGVAGHPAATDFSARPSQATQATGRAGGSIGGGSVGGGSIGGQAAASELSACTHLVDER